MFDHIASGLTSAEVAKALGVAPGTVSTHLLRIFAKVGVLSVAAPARLRRDAARIDAAFSPPAS